MAHRPIAMLVAAAAASGLAIGALTFAAAVPAHASAYRYWTYWQAEGDSWAFATQGPATSLPVDGAVEGWRFAVTTQSGAATDAPRVLPDFDETCGTTPPEAGSKRIALVIDFGPAAIAPANQVPPATKISCVIAPENASSLDVLQSTTTIRAESGLICALDAYPQGECAPVLGDDEVAALQAAASANDEPAEDDAVEAAGPALAPEPTDAGSPTATIVVAALLLGAAALSVALGRRRGRRDSHG